jgi:hypothetical protein
MQALAPTGSIATSEQTRKFVEGYFQLKPLGPTKVKGVSEPVSVYEVTGAFGKAIEVAVARNARSDELRSTLLLAQILTKQGRRDQARAKLAEIYNWFIEGFDTTRLREAKALLDELNA